MQGKWKNAFSGKQLDSVQEETLAVSATGVIVDKKAQSHSLAPKAQTQIDGRKALERFWLQVRRSLRKERPESVEHFRQRNLYESVV